MSLKRDDNNGTLHEAQCTFMVICRSFLLRMRNVSDRFVQKIKTHVLCSRTFYENRTVYEIMLNNTAQRDMPQVTFSYETYALHAPYLMLQTHTNDM